MQSDLHMLLAAGPLDLGDDKLQDIVLESPAGQRRRIDVETGFTVFEVKRDLRTGKVRARCRHPADRLCRLPDRSHAAAVRRCPHRRGRVASATAWLVTS